MEPAGAVRHILAERGRSLRTGKFESINLEVRRKTANDYPCGCRRSPASSLSELALTPRGPSRHFLVAKEFELWYALRNPTLPL
jgi:hypothetical protein